MFKTIFSKKHTFRTETKFCNIICNTELWDCYRLREGEDSFSCMWMPWPGGRAGSSSTMSPQEVLWRQGSRAVQVKTRKPGDAIEHIYKKC